MKIQLLKNFNIETQDIIDTVYAIEDAYTKEANECISEIEKLIKDKEDIDIHVLNYYITEIPIIIFNLVDNIQQLAVKSDAAKMQRKEVFNNSMMEQDTGTIADKTSVAQQACQNEQFIEDVFTRVYKPLRDDLGNTQLRRILSHMDKVAQIIADTMAERGRNENE